MGKLFDSPTLLIILIVARRPVFGSKRLPDAARGVGRSLRILKAETKGLMNDDDEDAQPAGSRSVQQAPAPADAVPAPARRSSPSTQPVQQPVAASPSADAAGAAAGRCQQPAPQPGGARAAAGLRLGDSGPAVHAVGEGREGAPVGPGAAASPATPRGA